MKQTDQPPLLPELREIHDRLTRNQRERRLLRTLQRLVLRHQDELEPTSTRCRRDNRQTSPGPGVAQ
jgi:hypothetical protein